MKRMIKRLVLAIMIVMSVNNISARVIEDAWMMMGRHLLMKWESFVQRLRKGMMLYMPSMSTSSIRHFEIWAAR